MNYLPLGIKRFVYRLAYPALLIYWFIARPRTLGVKCIVKRGGEVLLIKNTYGPKIYWTLPGGGLKHGESSETAIKREVLEEVGLELSKVTSLGQIVNKAEYKLDIVDCFLGESERTELITDPVEIAEAQWFYLNNLPYVSPVTQKILELLNPVNKS